MGRSQYYVLFDGGAWKIQCDGENSEPYAERRDAFKDAVALAGRHQWPRGCGDRAG